MRRLAVIAAVAAAAAALAPSALAVQAPILVAREAPFLMPEFLQNTASVWDGAGSWLDTFDADFTADDALAVGDVLDADGVDEVLVAGDETGTIDIFDMSGLHRAAFLGDFTIDDGLAVGDVNGFVGDEIVIAGDVTGFVDVFNGSGQKISSFFGDFTPGDGFALGDVNGDGVEEILIAGDGGGILDIFDINGQHPLPSFDVVFTPDDGLAAGDVNGDGVDEVLVGGDVGHAVDIFNAVSQQLIGSFDGDFTINDIIQAGDVSGDSADEIVIFGDETGTIDVFSGGGAHLASFGTFMHPFDFISAMAVGRNNYPDQDLDGLLDGWETFGMTVDGLFIDLPAMGADPLHKDLFLEFDWDNVAVPTQAAIQGLKAAFAAAPQGAGGSPNPDGQPGITLHVDTGSLTDANGAEGPTAAAGTCSDGLDNDGDSNVDAADNSCLAGDNLGGGNQLSDQGACGIDDDTFYDVKDSNFDDRRGWVFRYAISGNGAGCNTGGQGEIGGNDFIEFNHDTGTIMHELGHNLGLHHGGHTDFNCKPNYVSVMNYDHQFGIPQFGSTNVVFSYSPAPTPTGLQNVPLPGIDEDSLSESLVFDPADPVNMVIFVNGAGFKVQSPANATFIDWDGDGVQDGGTVQVNVDTSGANGRPAACTNGDDDVALFGSSDWFRIALNHRRFPDSADGAINPVPDPEPTLADRDLLWAELNTTDLSASIADAPDPAVAGEELTYTATVENHGPNPANEPRVVIALPDGVSYQSGTAGCGPTPSGVACKLAAMPARTSKSVSVTVLVDADLVYKNGGPKTITATATADNVGWPDSVPGNDSDSTNTLVIAKADLDVVSLAALDPPADVLIGKDVSIVLRRVITNHGPSAPMDTKLTATGTAPADGTVAPGSAVKQEPALAKNELRNSDETFTIVCHAPGPHTFSFTSEIEPLHPADTDPNPANNAKSTTVTVDCVVPVKVEIHPPPVNGGKSGAVALDVLTTDAGEFDLPLAFDATTILPLTVRFGREEVVWLETGGSAESHEKGHPHTASDGDTDMLMHFPVPGSGLQAGDQKACVKGKFTDGPNTYKFFGCDAVDVK